MRQGWWQESQEREQETWSFSQGKGGSRGLDQEGTRKGKSLPDLVGDMGSFLLNKMDLRLLPFSLGNYKGVRVKSVTIPFIKKSMTAFYSFSNSDFYRSNRFSFIMHPKLS